jgi:hypothetical protein
MTFIYFLCMMGIGLGLIVYRERVQRITGNFAFAEKYLGVGGTFNFILLVGVGFIVFSVLYVTGGLDAAIESTVGRFFITR